MAIHRAVYAARPDVGAVVHAHLPAAMALTLAGEVPDPAALPETALLLPRLPFSRSATPGSAELAAGIAAAFATGPEPLPGAVLLERHGAVAVGATVDQAINRLELVEVLCRAWRDALLIRAAVTDANARTILPRAEPPQEEPVNIRALVAEVVGTFILVFVGFLGVTTFVISTSGQGDSAQWPADPALLVRAWPDGRDRHRRARLGRPLQPGGHPCGAVRWTRHLEGRDRVRDRPDPRRARGGSRVRLLISASVVAAAVNQPGPIGATPFDAELHAFSAEAALTAIFVAVILTVTRKNPDQAIVVIPLTLVAIHFAGIFTSGASVNPARSLAPAIVSGNVQLAVGLPDRPVRRLGPRLGRLPLPHATGRRGGARCGRPR